MAAVITIDGTQYQDYVQFRKSEFITQVNGSPGTCRIILNDPGRNKLFVTGNRVTLTVDGLVLWTGYLTKVRRVYPFSAHSPSTRTYELLGVDINILFQRRYVLNKGNMDHARGKEYPPGTPDVVAIADLVTDYLDLSTDDLDVSSLVTNIGNFNEAQKSTPYEPSQTWAQALQSMGFVLFPVWYLNPDRKLVWADVDSESGAFGLTDNTANYPRDSGYVGVRELTIYKDATQMANDVLYIGAGYGSDKPVFKRIEDQGSIDLHGRWQYGQIITGIYKQASINRIASSFINGSPSSKRGHKDDKVTITCSMYETGLRAGDRVQFISDIWNFDDVLPIRSMRVTWGVKQQPRYDLTISHELDTQVGFFDPTQAIILRPIIIKPIVPIIIPTDGGGTPLPGPCAGDVTVFDNWQRVVDFGLGVASSGAIWTGWSISDGASVGMDENGMGWASLGPYTSGDNDGVGSYSAISPLVIGSDFWIRTKVDATGGSFGYESLGDLSLTFNELEVDIRESGSLFLERGWGATEIGETTVGLEKLNPLWIVMQKVGNQAYLKVWHGSIGSEPSGWNVSGTITGVESSGYKQTVEISYDVGQSTNKILLDEIDYSTSSPEMINISYMVEDFNRTSSGSWGTSSSGPVWSDDSQATLSINGNAGVAVGTGSQMLSGIETTGADVELVIRFRPDAANNGMEGYSGIAFQIIGGPGDPNTISTVSFSTNGGYPNTIYNTEGLPSSPWYTLRWDYKPSDGTSMCQIGRDGYDSPSGWFSAAGNVYTGTETTQITLVIEESVSGAGVSWFEIDYVSISYETPCAGQVISTPTSGRICETLIADGTAEFNTTQPYVAGSLTVAHHGIQQSVTETDPTTGFFTLSYAVDLHDTVWACYIIDEPVYNWGGIGAGNVIGPIAI